MDKIRSDLSKVLDLVPLVDRDIARKLLESAFQTGEAFPDQNSQEDSISIHDGIRNIADSIVVAKKEVANLRLPENKRQNMEQATSELDEIVKTTEEATNQIISSSEEIDRAVSNMRSSGVLSQVEIDKIQNEYLNIMMACSFQDITGQRISKIVGALYAIEEKVDQLMDLLGVEYESTTRKNDKQSSEDPDQHLMNGPVAPGEEAINQSNIDSLFDD